MNSRRASTAAICAILACSTISTAALGQDDPAAQSAMTGNGEGSSSSFSEMTADQSQGAGCCDAGFGQPCSPRWSASAEFITLQRLGTVNQTLVSTYPPHSPIVVGTGTERLNSEDLGQGFAAGPEVGLTYHGDGGCDLELSYFQIDGWGSAKSVEPNGTGGGGGPPPNWLVFTAPGDFVQTTDYADQAMAWRYATKLNNAELNVRWELCPRVTVLAGFRWVNLWEDLQGTLPPERAMPFWDTRTRNNLYGLQLGEDWKMLDWGRFSLDGLVKAGVFDNNAAETTGVSIYRSMYWESAATNQLAFLGEIGLQAKYQLIPRLLLKAGYEAIWLQGVALAPGQIPKTFCNGDLHDTYVKALGIDSGSGVFYHGATAGLEYSF
ncbi:MAG: hypothetical protein ABSG86_31645 [Thermoguttaceae bacterium]|jgi:hypothetical protein